MKQLKSESTNSLKYIAVLFLERDEEEIELLLWAECRKNGEKQTMRKDIAIPFRSAFNSEHIEELMAAFYGITTEKFGKTTLDDPVIHVVNIGDKKLVKLWKKCILTGLKQGRNQYGNRSSN